ncbi:hypothetical protein PDK27_11100, partial [Bacillus cereus group sp. TH230-1LC]|nr:hypothetical protein [Bacillus cereus group sp. TH230-1LC]
PNHYKFILDKPMYWALSNYTDFLTEPLYQRFSKYIDRNSKYISDFSNISTYRQNTTIYAKKEAAHYGSLPHF